MLDKYRYQLISQEIDECARYASIIDVGHYSDRDNQTEEDVKRIQQFVCKTTEFGAQHYLIDNGYKNVSPPDTNKYPVGEKSWSPDITTSQNNVHVKGQSLKSALGSFGFSWTFEKNDTHIFKSYQKNDVVMFVVANIHYDDNDKNKIVKVITEIKAIIPVVDLHKHKLLFQPPQKDYLKESKLVIYLNNEYCDENLIRYFKNNMFCL